MEAQRWAWVRERITDGVGTVLPSGDGRTNRLDLSIAASIDRNHDEWDAMQEKMGDEAFFEMLRTSKSEQGPIGKRKDA